MNPTGTRYITPLSIWLHEYGSRYISDQNAASSKKSSVKLGREPCHSLDTRSDPTLLFTAPLSFACFSECLQVKAVIGYEMRSTMRIARVWFLRSSTSKSRLWNCWLDSISLSTDVRDCPHQFEIRCFMPSSTNLFSTPLERADETVETLHWSHTSCHLAHPRIQSTTSSTAQLVFYWGL